MIDNRIMSMNSRERHSVTILDYQARKDTTSLNEVKYQHDPRRKMISNQSIAFHPISLRSARLGILRSLARPPSNDLNSQQRQASLSFSSKMTSKSSTVCRSTLQPTSNAPLIKPSQSPSMKENPHRAFRTPTHSMHVTATRPPSKQAGCREARACGARNA